MSTPVWPFMKDERQKGLILWRRILIFVFYLLFVCLFVYLFVVDICKIPRETLLLATGFHFSLRLLGISWIKLIRISRMSGIIFGSIIISLSTKGYRQDEE
jgi:hypothetical protein